MRGVLTIIPSYCFRYRETLRYFSKVNNYTRPFRSIPLPKRSIHHLSPSQSALNPHKPNKKKKSQRKRKTHTPPELLHLLPTINPQPNHQNRNHRKQEQNSKSSLLQRRSWESLPIANRRRSCWVDRSLSTEDLGA